MDNNKKNDSKKKLIKGLLLILGIAIYLLGGVQFMSYVIISIMFFVFGSLYRKIKVEYQDYKMLKLVQKSMIKLEDYKSLQDENERLKEKNNALQSTLTSYSSIGGGVTVGVPTPNAGVIQHNNLSNLDKLREVLND